MRNIYLHTSKTTAAYRDGNIATNNSLILAVELFAAQDSVSATEAVSIWKVAADFWDMATSEVSSETNDF